MLFSPCLYIYQVSKRLFKNTNLRFCVEVFPNDLLMAQTKQINFCVEFKPLELWTNNISTAFFCYFKRNFSFTFSSRLKTSFHMKGQLPRGWFSFHAWTSLGVFRCPLVSSAPPSVATPSTHSQQFPLQKYSVFCLFILSKKEFSKILSSGLFTFTLFIE